MSGGVEEYTNDLPILTLVPAVDQAPSARHACSTHAPDTAELSDSADLVPIECAVTHGMAAGYQLQEVRSI